MDESDGLRSAKTASPPLVNDPSCDPHPGAYSSSVLVDARRRSWSMLAAVAID